VWQL